VGRLGIVALVGFYDTLRLAGPVMILAPILGAVGLTLVTVSHLIPIAMGYELVPAYLEADPGGQATLAATADTFAAIALVTNAAGNFLVWGVVVPLYAVAILTTRALPRWIGWLGLLVGALGGWLGLLSPASSVISSISNIGFIAFFVFMLSIQQHNVGALPADPGGRARHAGAEPAVRGVSPPAPQVRANPVPRYTWLASSLLSMSNAVRPAVAGCLGNGSMLAEEAH
jgi:hypothetical protein